MSTAEKYPYLLGSFKWTAMDYIGEAGIGRPIQVPASRKLPNGINAHGAFLLTKVVCI